MKKIFFSVYFLLAFCCTGYGQAADYYRSVEGLKKAELKTALHELIQPDYVLSYGGKGEGYTWAGFVVTDALPDGYVLDRYSNEQRKFNGLNAVEGMNIEHSFANSWWGHTVNNAYCDLFNLYPSDGTANGRKSNNPIGVVTETPAFDNGVTKVGKSTSYRADSLITVWEPADEWKGDFARAYFYMATCYEDYTDLWQTTEGLLMVEKNRYPTLRLWVCNLLLQWNKEDPVDEVERVRNEKVFGIQGNRNPFVDYPQLSSYIWGDSTEYAFYVNKDEHAPELFVPAPNGVADFGLQALAKGCRGSLKVRGRNMTGGLSLSVNTADFELDRTSLTEEEVLAGTTVSVLCHASGAGVNEAVLTFTGQDFVQTNTLRVEFVDGIPAYPASNVVCSANAKRFTASWMAMGEELTYTLSVYTKDASGNAVPVSGYPKEMADTSCLVENLAASTTYYYRVSLPASGDRPAMQSNEVKVEMPAATPVFTVNHSELSFFTCPGRPSPSQVLTVTLLEVPQYVCRVSVESPFEISSDGENWGSELTLGGAKPEFFVRMGSVPEEGLAECEMVISTSGVQDIIVTLTGEADKQKAFFETFEAGSKSAYAAGEETCSAGKWKMTDALVGTLANDRKNGSRAVRMRTKASLEMLDDKVNGCDSLSFYAGLYGTDSGTGSQLTVSYSQDGGISWTPVADALTFTKGEWKRYVYYLHADGLIRVKFDWAPGGSSKRLNVDDVQMNDYNTSGNGVSEATSVSPDDIVKVYTLGGIYVRTAKRKDALKGLKPDCYILK